MRPHHLQRERSHGVEQDRSAVLHPRPQNEPAVQWTCECPWSVDGSYGMLGDDATPGPVARSLAKPRVDPLHHFVHASRVPQRRAQDRASSAQPLRLTQHHLDRSAHQIGQVDLVDEQQVRVRLRWTTFARDLLAAGDVDHIDGVVHQLRAEGGRQVVAARFDQQQVQFWKQALQVLGRVDVDRDVVAHGRVRAGAGFDADDALGRERPGPHQELGILAGEDVVGDHRHAQAIGEPPAEHVDQGRLARPDRPADADADRVHDRNNLANWCSWAMPARSNHGENTPNSSRGIVHEVSTAARTAGLSRCSKSCTPDWPILPRRWAAESC